VNSHRSIVIVVCFGLALLAAGCRSKSSTNRLPVHGTVTINNREAFNGSITFLPLGGRPGPAATTGVSNGVYRFDRNNGPTAGQTKVIIYRIVPRTAMLDALIHKSGKRPNFEWYQAADVPDDGQYTHDFTVAE
jgi:hypothetical protein